MKCHTSPVHDGLGRKVCVKRRGIRSQDVELAHDDRQDQGQLKSEKGAGMSEAAAGEVNAQVVHAVLQACHLHQLYIGKA